MERKELEEKVTIYHFLQARLNALLAQRNWLVSRLAELELLLNHLKDVMEQRSCNFQIGPGTWVEGRVEGNSFLVEVGAGVVLEKDLEGARLCLEKRKGQIHSALRSLQTGIESTLSQLDRLVPEIRKLIK